MKFRVRPIDDDGRPYLGGLRASTWRSSDSATLRLPVGDWTLEIESGDGQSWRLPVTVRDSVDTKLTIP